MEKRIMYFEHTKHKQLWNWIAEHPGALKSEWPGWHNYFFDKERMSVFSFCFACAAVSSCYKHISFSVCERCPLSWPLGLKCTLPSYQSLYRRFCGAENKNNELASRLARQIANLPLASYDDVEIFCF